MHALIAVMSVICTLALLVISEEVCVVCQGYDELQGILSGSELQELACSQHIPCHVIMRLTETLYTCNKVGCKPHCHRQTRACRNAERHACNLEMRMLPDKTCHPCIEGDLQSAAIADGLHYADRVWG